MLTLEQVGRSNAAMKRNRSIHILWRSPANNYINSYFSFLGKNRTLWSIYRCVWGIFTPDRWAMNFPKKKLVMIIQAISPTHPYSDTGLSITPRILGMYPFPVLVNYSSGISGRLNLHTNVRFVSWKRGGMVVGLILKLNFEKKILKLEFG